jgi:hypothetical protein
MGKEIINQFIMSAIFSQDMDFGCHFLNMLSTVGLCGNLNVEVEDPAGKDEEVWNPCEIRNCGRETAHPN